MPPAPDLFVVCKSCGSEVSSYVTECPYCGTRLRKRAPKLDAPELTESPARRAARRRGCRSCAPGEIPGLSADPTRRPYATIVLVVACALGTIALAAFAAVAGRARRADRRRVVARGDVPVLRRQPLVRRGVHGHDRAVRHAARAAARAARRRPRLLRWPGWAASPRPRRWRRSRSRSAPTARRSGLIGAWVVRPVLETRRGEEPEADLVGAAVMAAVLLLMPLVVTEASPTAGAAGLLVGLLAGLALARR